MVLTYIIDVLGQSESVHLVLIEKLSGDSHFVL